MIITALFSSIVIGIGSFAWGYFQAGNDAPSRWILAFGIFWLIALWQKWRWVSTLSVLLAIPLSIIGLWLDLVVGWMFSGMVFTLFAWDLTEFQLKMRRLPLREDVKGMTRRHLLRIGLLTLGGFLLALALGWFRA